MNPDSAAVSPDGFSEPLVSGTEKRTYQSALNDLSLEPGPRRSTQELTPDTLFTVRDETLETVTVSSKERISTSDVKSISDFWFSSYLERIPQIDRIPGVDELRDFLYNLAKSPRCDIREKEIPGGGSFCILTVTSPFIKDQNEPAIFNIDPHGYESQGRVYGKELATLFATDETLLPLLGTSKAAFIFGLDSEYGLLSECETLSLREYNKNLIRPAQADQAEFALLRAASSDQGKANKNVPGKTWALMDLTGEVNPSFVCSFHGVDMGAVFFEVSHDLPGLATELGDLASAQGFPVAVSDVDVAGWEKLGKGVFLNPSEEDSKRSDGTPSGMLDYPLITYMKRRGAFTIIPELPRWKEPEMADESPYGGDYRQFLYQSAARSLTETRHLTSLFNRVRPNLTLNTPIYRAVADSLRLKRVICRNWEKVAQKHNSGETVTVAQVANVKISELRASLRCTGMLLRLLDTEIEAGNKDPKIKATRESLWPRFAAHSAQSETMFNDKASNLRSMAVVEIGAIFAALTRCKQARLSRAEKRYS